MLCTAVQAAGKAKIKYKPLVDEEDERRRASAAAKLRALDEAIARRRAEEERCAAELVLYYCAHLTSTQMTVMCRLSGESITAVSCACGMLCVLFGGDPDLQAVAQPCLQSDLL